MLCGWLRLLWSMDQRECSIYLSHRSCDYMPLLRLRVSPSHTANRWRFIWEMLSRFQRLVDLKQWKNQISLHIERYCKVLDIDRWMHETGVSAQDRRKIRRCKYSMVITLYIYICLCVCCALPKALPISITANTCTPCIRILNVHSHTCTTD